jgi:DNA excision repair protein ERCC-8
MNSILGCAGWCDAARRDLERELVESITLQGPVCSSDWHRGPVWALDADPVEQRFLLSGGTDRVLHVTDTRNTTPWKPICSSSEAHEAGISSVQWFPFDSGSFVSSGLDDLVRLWDTNFMRPVLTFHSRKEALLLNESSGSPGDVGCLQARFSPIASHLLIACANQGVQQVRICDPRTGGSTHQLSGHTRGVTCLDWSSSNEFMLFSGSRDKTIRVWDIRRPGALACLDEFNQVIDPTAGSTAHAFRLISLKALNSGGHLLSGASDGSLHLWDTDVLERLPARFAQTRSKRPRFCVTSNSRFIFYAHGEEILVFETESGELVKVLTELGLYSIAGLCFLDYEEVLLSSDSRGLLLSWSSNRERLQVESRGKLSS